MTASHIPYTRMPTTPPAATPRSYTATMSISCTMAICIIRMAITSTSIDLRSTTATRSLARQTIDVPDTRPTTYTVPRVATRPFRMVTMSIISSMATCTIRMAIIATITAT